VDKVMGTGPLSFLRNHLQLFIEENRITADIVNPQASTPDTTNLSSNVASATDDKSFIPESSEDETFGEEQKCFSEPLSTLQIHKDKNTNPRGTPINYRVLNVFASLFKGQGIMK
jgi:hypothetical protein